VPTSLVIDDALHSATSVRLLLWAHNRRVLETRSVPDAIAVLERQCVDEILLPLRLRGGAGAQLTEAVTRLSRTGPGPWVGFYHRVAVLAPHGRFVPLSDVLAINAGRCGQAA
jgi:hypothetical protein